MSELYASIDLGGTNIKCVFADAEGTVAASDAIPTASHEGPDGVLFRIGSLVERMIERAGIRPRALGMGVPGLVDLKRGVTRFLPNLATQWRDVPVRDILSPRLGCPVYLLNDVRTATLGELVFGHGRRVTSFVFFAIGTGIGGGIVIDGKLRLGPLGAAGELGHQTVIPDGPVCGCGSRGCMETLISGPALSGVGVRLVRSGLAPKLHDIVGGDLNLVTPETMAAAANKGDGKVREEILRAAEYLAIGIGNMITALHPDMVVLGGGVVQMGDLLLNRVRESLRERVHMVPVDDVPIELSLLADQAGALGGIALAMKRGLIED
jgi:glucokinase